MYIIMNTVNTVQRVVKLSQFPIYNEIEALSSYPGESRDGHAQTSLKVLINS